MSPLTRYRSTFAAFLITSLLWGLLALYANDLFVVAFFANVFFWSWALYQPRCSHCHATIAPPIGSPLANILRSLTHKRCRECRAELVHPPT